MLGSGRCITNGGRWSSLIRENFLPCSSSGSMLRVDLTIIVELFTDEGSTRKMKISH
jgi:hypothetical protein